MKLSRLLFPLLMLTAVSAAYAQEVRAIPYALRSNAKKLLPLSRNVTLPPGGTPELGIILHAMGGVSGVIYSWEGKFQQARYEPGGSFSNGAAAVSGWLVKLPMKSGTLRVSCVFTPTGKPDRRHQAYFQSDIHVSYAHTKKGDAWTITDSSGHRYVVVRPPTRAAGFFIP